jgi:hypothetical protein
MRAESSIVPAMGAALPGRQVAPPVNFDVRGERAAAVEGERGNAFTVMVHDRELDE